MWMDIAVGIMTVLAFGVSLVCFFEGSQDCEDGDKKSF